MDMQISPESREILAGVDIKNISTAEIMAMYHKGEISHQQSVDLLNQKIAIQERELLEGMILLLEQEIREREILLWKKEYEVLQLKMEILETQNATHRINAWVASVFGKLATAANRSIDRTREAPFDVSWRSINRFFRRRFTIILSPEDEETAQQNGKSYQPPFYIFKTYGV